MNILIIHADKFLYLPQAKSPKATISVREDSFRKSNYNDCLVAFITIGQDDNPKKINACVKQLLKASKDISCNDIVLMPISHLLPNPKDPIEAFEYFKIIREKLAEHSFINCYLEPYGFIGNWEIAAKGHATAVLGRWI